jgi:hypothetical protein
MLWLHDKPKRCLFARHRFKFSKGKSISSGKFNAYLTIVGTGLAGFEPAT